MFLASLFDAEHSLEHELTVTAQQLASVAQLVRVLHRNRRAVGSIPTRGPCAAFFAVVPDHVLIKVYIFSLGLLTLKTAF